MTSKLPPKVKTDLRERWASIIDADTSLFAPYEDAEKILGRRLTGDEQSAIVDYARHIADRVRRGR